MTIPNSEKLPRILKLKIYRLLFVKVYTRMRYEYTNSWEKLQETSLPRQEDFYNTLGETVISDEEYEHAMKV